jgi:hypothetical protein
MRAVSSNLAGKFHTLQLVSSRVQLAAAHGRVLRLKTLDDLETNDKTLGWGVEQE